MTLDELKGRLSIGSEELTTKVMNRIAIVEWWRPWAAGLAVIGAAVAGFSRLVTNDQVSVGMAVGGAVLAAVCSLAAALMDYKKLEISSEARNAFKLTEDALAELEKERPNYRKSVQLLTLRRNSMRNGSLDLKQSG